MPISSIDGWVEEGEDIKKTVPINCPKCGKRLNKVDARNLCGILFVYCLNSTCRYAEIYE